MSTDVKTVQTGLSEREVAMQMPLDDVQTYVQIMCKRPCACAERHCFDGRFFHLYATASVTMMPTAVRTTAVIAAIADTRVQNSIRCSRLSAFTV